MSTTKQNAKKDPTKRPKNLPRLNSEDEKCRTILILRKNKEIGKIVHKQNATNANLTCITSIEEVKVRKQPDEFNKCPSVLRKSVSWWILASFPDILVKATCAG